MNKHKLLFPSLLFRRLQLEAYNLLGLIWPLLNLFLSDFVAYKCSCYICCKLEWL